MTEEAQRIAIAEACPNIRCHSYTHSPEEVWEWFNGEFWMECNNNDPLHDLNAMHKAEKALLKTKAQWDSFQQRLFIVVANDNSEYPITHATAAQRAEAFLRTIGKWEEGK